jgi:hypothetical protein
MEFEALKATDEEIGSFVASLICGNSNEQIGAKVRIAFDHSCQAQGDAGTIMTMRMFARYMKDAWRTPEGHSCILHAMQIMGRFKRHEDRLRALVAGKTVADDVPILAACEILRNGSMDIVCVPVTEGVKHE